VKMRVGMAGFRGHRDLPRTSRLSADNRDLPADNRDLPAVKSRGSAGLLRLSRFFCQWPSEFSSFYQAILFVALPKRL
jgi:hypothetical protein